MLDGITTASIIFNPVSGGGKSNRLKHLEDARKILRASGIDAELLPTSAPGHAGEIPAGAIVKGSQLIIACGGDGTLNEIVNGMPGSKVPIALLPAGTANILAKELRIPWNIPQAAALIPTGIPTRIALGAITKGDSSSQATGANENRRYFLVVTSAGADGALVHALDPGVKQRAGVLAYWMEGAKQLLRYKFPQFRVTTEGTEIVATLVIVGRTKHYGGPFRITRGADLLANEFELGIFSLAECASIFTLSSCLLDGTAASPEGRAFHKIEFGSMRRSSAPTRYIRKLTAKPANHCPSHFQLCRTR